LNGDIISQTTAKFFDPKYWLWQGIFSLKLNLKEKRGLDNDD